MPKTQSDFISKHTQMNCLKKSKDGHHSNEPPTWNFRRKKKSNGRRKISWWKKENTYENNLLLQIYLASYISDWKRGKRSPNVLFLFSLSLSLSPPLFYVSGPNHSRHNETVRRRGLGMRWWVWVWQRFRMAHLPSNYATLTCPLKFGGHTSRV